LTSRGTWQRRSRSNRAWLPAFLLAALLVSACGGAKSKPAAADGRAGLVFTRQSGQISGVWVAAADGSSPRQIVANGSDGTLSPDGRQMTYSIPRGVEHWMTNIKNVAVGDPRPLGEVTVLAWSPDSTHLAVRDKARLLLVDAESGVPRELASGSVGEASFSPDGTAIAFSRGNGKVAPKWRSDIFVVRLSGGPESRLTHDGHTNEPAWGANWIAFRRFHYEGVWPVGVLYVMRPDGSDAQRLAAGKESPVPTVLGLDAVELSKDGTKLLGCAAGEFHCGPVTFDVPGGAPHDLSLDAEAVTQVEDLSEDGMQVLATAGAFDGPPRDLYAIPFAGGSSRLLLKNVSSASWAG
jgi:Tol biopolymer transport system component